VLGAIRPLVRDAIELPSNFTATIDGQLKVSSLEESITVTGDSSVVDVQSAARRSTCRSRATSKCRGRCRFSRLELWRVVPELRR
jgi:hypothetical protein